MYLPFLKCCSFLDCIFAFFRLCHRLCSDIFVSLFFPLKYFFAVYATDAVLILLYYLVSQRLFLFVMFFLEKKLIWKELFSIFSSISVWTVSSFPISCRLYASLKYVSQKFFILVDSHILSSLWQIKRDFFREPFCSKIYLYTFGWNYTCCQFAIIGFFNVCISLSPTPIHMLTFVPSFSLAVFFKY